MTPRLTEHAFHTVKMLRELREGQPHFRGRGVAPLEPPLSYRLRGCGNFRKPILLWKHHHISTALLSSLIMNYKRHIKGN